ncbi:MAG: ribosome silencing factor [Candidatus Hydrogenedens sp.]|nr:ribosome silencing factor [Candidatus Hydrogenedentota bacterium]NLF59219.1 ribosome silencing factor [Candidatus Hydrogenedens sp.]
MAGKKKTGMDKALLEKVLQAAEIAAEKKAGDIRAYDVRGLTLMADAFIICSASSEPQLRAIASAAREDMKDLGHSVLRVEGDHHCGWLIVDYGDVIFHVFRESARSFYDLDRMWADAPEIPLPDGGRDGGPAKN